MKVIYFSCFLLLSGFIFGAASADYIDTTNDLDFREMDEILFPSWRGLDDVLELQSNNEAADDMDVNAESNSDKTPFVNGIIGVNYDQNLLMDFFSRFADILIKFVAPVMFFFLIFTSIRMIVASGKSAASEREIAMKYFTNALIATTMVVLAYSFVKILFFFLIQ